MVRFENFELLTGRKIIALPAADELFLSSAVSYLAVGWATVTFTELFAAHLHHCAQQIIALVIILKFLEEWHLCKHVSHLIESVVP